MFALQGSSSAAKAEAALKKKVWCPASSVSALHSFILTTIFDTVLSSLLCLTIFFMLIAFELSLILLLCAFQFLLLLVNCYVVWFFNQK